MPGGKVASESKRRGASRAALAIKQEEEDSESFDTKKTRTIAKKVTIPKKEEFEEEDEEKLEDDEDFVPKTKKKRATVKTAKNEKVKEEQEDGDATVEKKARKTAKKATVCVETEEEKSLRETVGAKIVRAAEGSNKHLGYHASAAGSVTRSIFDARSLGCRAFALFIRNQRQWTAKAMEEGTVEEWKETITATGFPLDMIIPHASYLINPGSPDAEKLQKSRDAMLDECERCERLGITLYNFHPGSSTGACTAEECIATVAASIDYILERTQNIVLVVETMAGQGYTVGGKFEEIRAILDAVKGAKDRVGVCIDTCHIFAAGYDIRTRTEYDKTMEEFGRIVGFDRLKALHLNDSKSELGSHLDRHERIGKGKIGKETFEFIMNDERLANIPLILETPEGDYDNEMQLLYGMEEKTKK